MEYKNIDGHVYSRYALTPPIVNSAMADQFGIQAPCVVEDPGQYTQIEEGKNVKLRLLVDAGTRKMTCHAKIDWVKRDDATGACMVGFGKLSLTDEEFRVLEKNFVAESDKAVVFGVKVRDTAAEAKPVVVSGEAKEIMRMKAVNFPVSIIELIDEKRGDVSFSEFVVSAVKEHLRK